MGTRAGSSYKEEVLRFLHSKPNGVFSDDGVGVTSAVATALQEAGLPVSMSTVSSAISSLHQGGRIEVTYGHRSLDNKLLMTSVVVLAEPHDGVALAPSELPGHREMPEREKNLVLAELRKLVRLIKEGVSLSDEEIEKFREHVGHLVEENEQWESLAREAEEGHASAIAEVRSELTEARDEIAFLQEQVTETEAENATLRQELTVTKRELSEKTSELDAFDRAVEFMNDRIKEIGVEVENVAASRDKFRSEVNRMHGVVRQTISTAQRREKELIGVMLMPVSRFSLGLMTMLESATTSGKNLIVDNDVLVALGLRGENGGALELGDMVYINFDRALTLMAFKNHMTNLTALPSDESRVTFVANVLNDLDTRFGTVRLDKTE